MQRDIVEREERMLNDTDEKVQIQCADEESERLRDFSYEIGKLHTTSHYAGFQAFVNRADAEEAIESAWAGFVVRKVYLYQATQGIITRMDHYSNGRPGWAAKKIRIPRLRK